MVATILGLARTESKIARALVNGTVTYLDDFSNEIESK